MYNIDELKNNMLSKISQVKKDKYCIYHLCKISKIDKCVGKKSRLEVARGCSEKEIVSYSSLHIETLELDCTTL